MSYCYPQDNRRDHIVADKNNRRQAYSELLVMVFVTGEIYILNTPVISVLLKEWMMKKELE